MIWLHRHCKSDRKSMLMALTEGKESDQSVVHVL